MNQLAFHIGLHKTGTSYLQRVVFPRFEDLSFSTGWHSLRSVLLERGGEEKVLLSDERLAGKFIRGEWLEQFRRNAENLRRLFGETSVIIGFRRHDALLVSMYKQYLQEGGTGSIRDLFDPASGRGILASHEWSFRDRLEFLDRRFPRVFVYTQEELRDRPGRLIRELAEWLGVPAPSLEEMDRSRKNRGVRGAFQARMLRRLNRLNRKLEKVPLVPSLENPLFRSLRITPRRICQNRLANVSTGPLRLPDDIREHLLTEYADDWAYVNRRRENRR